MLSIVIFAAVGNLGAAIIIVLQQGVSVVAGLLSIVVVISGTLFPVSEFPPWLQVVAHLSPLTYALEALRSSLLSQQPATSIIEDLLVLVAFAVVLLPMSAFGLERAFAVAQRRGTLATF